MKFLSKLVDRKTLVLTYTMHVRPHLEYKDIIFHGCGKSLMDCLERIQYQAGLIATGCWKNTNKEKLYIHIEFVQSEPLNANSTFR